MTQCPSCQHELDDDFGLVNCANCGAAVFIDIDGVAKVSDSEAREELSNYLVDEVTRNVSLSEGQILADSGSEHLQNLEDQFPHTATASQVGAIPPEGFAEASANGALEDLDSPILQSPVQESAEEAPQVIDPTEIIASPQDELQKPAPAAPQVSSRPLNQAGSDLRDIAEFGNASSPANEGHLRFNIFISGIDTQFVRDQLQEALADERFLWDFDNLLKSIKEGHLELSDVSAVKAAVLLQKIKYLPLGIAWEQYDIHQV